MRILVTGSRGFVGSETCRLLEEHGHEVVHYDIMDSWDIRDKDLLENRILEMASLGEDIDRILHLAAIARFDEADADPVRTHETNVLGTMNVVEVAKKYHIPLVFASTGSAYMPIKSDPPITEDFPIMGNSTYGCSKALADLYVQAHNPHIILRYAHLYGAEKRWHGLIGGFLKRIQHDMEPVLYGGRQSNDMTYIKDIAEANLLALTAPWDSWNNVYNVGTGAELTAKDAGDIICDVFDYKGHIQVKDQRSVDAQRFVFDVSKAERMLGYVPKYSFKEGLEDMKSIMEASGELLR